MYMQIMNDICFKNHLSDVIMIIKEALLNESLFMH